MIDRFTLASDQLEPIAAQLRRVAEDVWQEPRARAQQLLEASFEHEAVLAEAHAVVGPLRDRLE
jgi:hypothetical protein